MEVRLEGLILNGIWYGCYDLLCQLLLTIHHGFLISNIFINRYFIFLSQKIVKMIFYYFLIIAIIMNIIKDIARFVKQ
jgi:hypothetical protein